MKDINAGNLFHLGNMLDAMDAIEERLMLGFSEEVVKESTVFHLMTIGEAVTKLSDDLKNRYPDIPWQKIAGLRHKIVHEYYRIDYDQVETIVYGQLPHLHKQIESIIAEISA
ncbi:MAG: HepT-like ribonuclease domain-containing protein [Alphaproteobacteria bacterium]|nr:HepT-like ribonuclease domain-containing protein [Alphaproteobacteria bacterium]